MVFLAWKRFQVLAVVADKSSYETMLKNCLNDHCVQDAVV